MAFRVCGGSTDILKPAPPVPGPVFRLLPAVKPTLIGSPSSDQGSSISRYDAVLSIIAKRGAKDFFEGRVLDTGDYVESRINNHHVFSTNVEGPNPEKSKFFPELSDSILNRTLLLDGTN